MLAHIFTVALVFESAIASDLANADGTMDAACMLQGHLVSRNFTSYDTDYIYDSPEGDPPRDVDMNLSPDALFRLAVSTNVSVLIVLFAVLACLFTAGDSNQKPMAFRCVAHAIAAICALLMFKAIKDLVGHIFYRATSLSPHVVGFDFALLIIIFLIVTAWLFTYRTSVVVVEIAGTIGIYMVGFSWTDTYQMVVASRYNTVLMCLMALALFAIVFLSLMSIAPDSTKSLGQHVVTCEELFAALAIGYFASHLIEHGIGTLPICPMSKNTLLIVAIIFFVAGALYMAAKTTEIFERWSLFLRKICLMSAAWCLLDEITWQLSTDLVGKHLGLRPTSKAAAFFEALLVSLVVLIAFAKLISYTLAQYANPWDDFRVRNVSLLVNAMGFAVGCAWANYLIQVIIQFALRFRVIAPAVVTFLICGILCAVMIPFWYFLVVPNTVIMKPESMF